MIERIKKCLITLVAIPFILCVLGLVFGFILCLVLTMPLIALVRPDIVEIQRSEK